MSIAAPSHLVVPTPSANGASASDAKSSLVSPGSHHSVVHATSTKVEPWEQTKFLDPFTYTYGYGNELSSEALANALPKLGNTPMRCPYDLYAEQLSGTSFTTPRVHNRRTWIYKIRPSAAHKPFRPVGSSVASASISAECKAGAAASSAAAASSSSPASSPSSSSCSSSAAARKRFSLLTNDFTGENGQVNPNQLRWKPFPIPDMEKDGAVDFLDGLITIGGAGDPTMKAGAAIHVYCCNDSMRNKAFYNSDGDLLIVPQLTPLIITTEMGRLRAAPGEFAVIPRGVKFSVALDAPKGQAPTRGYICEVYDGHFIIPDLGPIGANGLANPRHFAAPTAWFENKAFGGKTAGTSPTAAVSSEPYELYNKFAGKMFVTEVETSPFDVVAWSGNYLPFKYDMAMFNTVNSVSFDHLDPSIFTVLTCQTASPGVAAIDFVVFPPRMAVQEDTFRPPYYHRNCMSEFMGNIMGQYDAKPEGFVPGSASLHSCMTGHGPDAATYDKFSRTESAPAGTHAASSIRLYCLILLCLSCEGHPYFMIVYLFLFPLPLSPFSPRPRAHVQE